MVIVDGIAASIVDGCLMLQDDGVTITLSHEKPEAAPAQIADENESAALKDYIGVWTITNVTAEGITLPAETARMSGETITVYGETCDISLMGTLLTDLPCAMDGHKLGFTLMDATAYLTLHTDGTLTFDMDDAMLWYQRTGDAPEKEITSTATEAPAEPALPTAEPSSASAATDFDYGAYVEKKFVMTDADMDGYNMTRDMLGGYEYSLVFHEDGKVDFIMAGAEIPGLTWTIGTITTEDGAVEGFIIDYYTNKLNVVPTESGLDMNYFDSMLMHFAAEE